MDLGRLSSIGASDNAESAKKTGNLNKKTYYADAALGKAIYKDTVCFGNIKNDSADVKKDLIQKLGAYFNEILKTKEEEIAKTPESEPVVKSAETSYEAYLTDIEETNANLPVGKKKKVPVSFEDYKKLYDNSTSMNKFAGEEIEHFDKKYFSELTGDFESVGIKKFSSRPKGVDSIQSKLVKKFASGDLKDASSYYECLSSIGDLEGGRLTIQNLSHDLAAEVLDMYGVKEEDYAAYMLGETNVIGNLDEETSATAATNISNSLKEYHTQSIADRLTDLVRTGRLEFNDEFNNYGNENTSYFTNGQIQQIADAHFEKTGKPLSVISCINFDNENTTELTFNKDNKCSGIINVKKKNDKKGNKIYSLQNNNQKEVAEIKSDKSVKKSGYSATQFNMLCKSEDGIQYGSELQIRGEAVNTYAEGEHVVYDILSGKTKITDEKHGKECRLINSLDDNSKKELYKCLQYVYTHGRLEEFGIKTEDLNFDKFKFKTPDGADRSEEIKNMLIDIFRTAKENDMQDTIKFKDKHPSVTKKF